MCVYELLCLLLLLEQILKGDLEIKRQMLGKLKLLVQDLLVAVKNKAVAQRLESRLESFAQRWDSLMQQVERNSQQVCETQHFVSW